MKVLDPSFGLMLDVSFFTPSAETINKGFRE